MKRVKRTILDNLRDPDSTAAEQNLQQERKVSWELQQKEIYLEHRIFLENYKKQQLISAQEQKGSSKSEKEQQQSQKQGREPTIQQLEKQEHRKNVESIEAKMQEIHNKLHKQFMKPISNEERDRFKVFSDIVENKKDIDRISKERTFIKSQTSKCFKYEEPRISSPMKIFKTRKIFTEAVGLEQLNKQAKQFSEKVQREQEKLWGNHFLARRIQEKKRDLEERKEEHQMKLQRQMRILQKYKNQKKSHFEQSQVLEKEEQSYQKSSRNMLRASRDEKVLQRYLTENKSRQINFKSIDSERTSKPRLRSNTQNYTGYQNQYEDTASVPRTTKLRKKMFSIRRPSTKNDQSLNQISVKLNPPQKNKVRQNLVRSQECADPDSHEEECQSECNSPLPCLLPKQSKVIISTLSEASEDR